MRTAISSVDDLGRLSSDARSRIGSVLGWRDLIGSVGGLLVVPSLRAPRLGVPAEAPLAAAAAVTRHGTSRSTKDLIARRSLAALLRSGIGRSAFARIELGGREDGVLEQLQVALGRDLVAAVPLTPARANRKPVLHLLDPRGDTVGFAKLGVSELTRQLVAREAQTLDEIEHVADAVRFTRVARVLGRGSWNGTNYVVFSPLPTWAGRAPSGQLLSRAMHEVSELRPPGAADGRTYPEALIDDLDQLLPRLDGPDLDAAMRTRAALVGLKRFAGDVAATSSWHGDWTAWNCCEVDGRIAVWDWERFEHGVPAGFDALHYALQHEISDGRVPLATAAQRCVADAPRVLQGWYPDAGGARVVAATYLAELTVRYLRDGQRGVGARGGDVSSWLVPSLERFVASDCTARPTEDQGCE